MDPLGATGRVVDQILTQAERASVPEAHSSRFACRGDKSTIGGPSTPAQPFIVRGAFDCRYFVHVLVNTPDADTFSIADREVSAVWGEYYLGNQVTSGGGGWDGLLKHWLVRSIPENDRHILRTRRHPPAVRGVDNGIHLKIVSKGGI